MAGSCKKMRIVFHLSLRTERAKRCRSGVGMAPKPLTRMADAGDDDAMTQLEPTQREPKAEASRCCVCGLDLSRKAILERELHVNACLDSASLDARYDCPTCGKILTDYNEQRRAAHVNMCLDNISGIASAVATPTRQLDVSTSMPSPSTADRVQSIRTETSVEVYACRICGNELILATIEERSRHIKQCGRRFGVRSVEMVPPRCSRDTNTDHLNPSLLELSAQLATAAKQDAFSVLMASNSTPSLSRQQTLPLPASSNAFDVLMKSAKTSAVSQRSSSSKSSTSARAFWHANATTTRSNKRMRTTGNPSTTHRQFSCPDFKRIIGTNPPFVVDGFRYAAKSLSSVYFLTHFHSDHYTGLQRSFDCGVIYCTEVTAALVVQELGVDSKYVHPVILNTPIDIHGVQVIFMDANHCPGAAIILFRLRSGVTYLHTGDFRFHPSMWKYSPLQRFLPRSESTLSTPQPATCRLDGVYLDTTYADPKYTFPIQEASITHAVSLLDKHLKSGAKILFLFGSYSIGKERLFMEAAKRFQRKVCVSTAKLKMIRTYKWPDADMKLITTEPAATNFHVVPMQELRLDHLIALQLKHRLRFQQIVAFRPTGWTFSRSSSSMSTCQSDPNGNVRIYGIPYSEHSSFAELCEFIRVLNPQSIIPTVNCHTDRNVKKQIDALRQSAFHTISAMLQLPSA